MSYEADVHQHQMIILRYLLLRPDAGFSELQKAAEVESDAATFHIKRLTQAGYLIKTGGRYTLTARGKEYSNRMDTDERVIEKQPKVAVCLNIYRGDGMQLVQQRLKQPYYGYWGRPTGKVRWGETILDCAARELQEETGLTAKLSFCSVFHKIDHNKANGELLEDKIFFVIDCRQPRGELIKEFEGGRNAWMTPAEYASQPLTFAGGGNPTPEMPRIPVVEKHFMYEPDHY